MVSQSFKAALSTRFSVRCSSLGQRSDRKAIRLDAIRLPSLDLTGRKRPDLDSYPWQPALEFGLIPTVEGSGAILKGSASGGNGLDDRTGLRTGTLQGSAFRPRDNCPVRAVVPDIQAQLP